MAEHNDLGQKGEELALAYLRKKGYKILETNWRHAKDEIDIIAKDKDELVIVEVKTRSSNYFGEPEVFVNRTKQKFLVRGANEYVIKKDIDDDTRFDIISVVIGKNQTKVHHIEDAFYPTL